MQAGLRWRSVSVSADWRKPLATAGEKRFWDVASPQYAVGCKKRRGVFNDQKNRERTTGRP